MLRADPLTEAKSSSSWNLQALDKIMLQLQRQCQDTVRVYHCTQERRGHAATRNMIAIALKTRKSLTTSHLHNHASPAALHSREESHIHRLSPVFGTAGEAQLPSTSLQVLISSPTILLKPKHQSSNQIGLMEVGCMLFQESLFLVPLCSNGQF